MLNKLKWLCPKLVWGKDKRVFEVETPEMEKGWKEGTAALVTGLWPGVRAVIYEQKLLSLGSLTLELV